MLGWLDIINWLCVLASICCAIWLWREASKSRKYASKVRKLEEMDDLDELKSSCKIVLNSIGKFGPGTTTDKIAGLDFSEQADIVKKHLLIMREHGYIIGDEFLESYCIMLENALDNEDKIKAGRIIHSYVSQCVTKIQKKRWERKREIMDQ